MRLHRETRLPLVLWGGSTKDDPVPEAALLKEATMTDFAVPVWLTEERSRTTFKNAAYTAAELRKHGITRILLVIHAWHILRAMWSFDQTGLHVIAAPTGFVTVDVRKPASWLPHANALARVRYALHEMLGNFWYRIRGSPEKS